MPFKSKKQQKFFNANRESMEKKGVDVDEWNKSSKGKRLPEKKKGSKRTKGKRHKGRVGAR